MKHIPNAPQILDKMRTYSVNRKVEILDFLLRFVCSFSDHEKFREFYNIALFQKHLLFEEISNYYGRLGAPLISAQWDEVIQAITNLISKFQTGDLSHFY